MNTQQTRENERKGEIKCEWFPQGCMRGWKCQKMYQNETMKREENYEGCKKGFLPLKIYKSEEINSINI